jgi:hypothetical protein
MVDVDARLVVAYQTSTTLAEQAHPKHHPIFAGRSSFSLLFLKNNEKK